MTNKQAETENYKMQAKPDVIKAALSVGKQIKTKAMFDAATGGGYCSKCDTVWCDPGTCNCVPGPLLQKYETATNVYEREVWNAAIETAAIRAAELLTLHTAKEIRKLKK